MVKIKFQISGNKTARYHGNSQHLNSTLYTLSTIVDAQILS